MPAKLQKELMGPLLTTAGAYEVYRSKQPLYTKDAVHMAVEWLLFELNDRKLWEYCPLAKEEKLKLKQVKLKIQDAFRDIYPYGAIKRR